MQQENRDSRQRLLDAASEVFAEQGFDKGTVRDICERADVNVAAVNYYFRSKRALYDKVLEGWRMESRERFPFDGGLPAGAGVKDRLRAFYLAALKRIFYGGGTSAAARGRASVAVRELISGLPEDVQEGRTQNEEMEGRLRAIVVDALEGASPLAVQDCVDSCLSQVTAYLLNFVSNPEWFQAMYDGGELQRIAEHMTSFALSGIRSVPRQSGFPAPVRANVTAFAQMPYRSAGSV